MEAKKGQNRDLQATEYLNVCEVLHIFGSPNFKILNFQDQFWRLNFKLDFMTLIFLQNEQLKLGNLKIMFLNWSFTLQFSI